MVAITAGIVASNMGLHRRRGRPPPGPPLAPLWPAAIAPTVIDAMPSAAAAATMIVPRIKVSPFVGQKAVRESQLFNMRLVARRAFLSLTPRCELTPYIRLRGRRGSS